MLVLLQRLAFPLCRPVAATSSLAIPSRQRICAPVFPQASGALFFARCARPRPRERRLLSVVGQYYVAVGAVLAELSYELIAGGALRRVVRLGRRRYRQEADSQDCECEFTHFRSPLGEATGSKPRAPISACKKAL